MTWFLVGAAALRITFWLRTRMQTASRNMGLLIAAGLADQRPVVDQQDTQR